MRAAVDHVFRSFRHEPSAPDVMSRLTPDDATPNNAAQIAAQLLANYRGHLAECSVDTAQAPSR